MLLDVAHNPAGAWTLRSALNSFPAASQKTLLFGCLRDKAFQEMEQVLFPLFDRVVLTPVDSPRSASVEDLASVARAVGVHAELAGGPLAGFAMAQQQTPPDGLVACAGSVYLVGPLREALLAAQDTTNLAIPDGV